MVVSGCALVLGLWWLLLQAGGTDSQFYEWRCTALDTNTSSYHLPDLRDTGLIIVPSATDEVSIYPVPALLNCRGTVSALRYRYTVFWYQLETQYLIFTLLTLEQNGLSLVVTDIIPVYSTPTAQICVPVTRKRIKWTCYGFLQLDIMDRFHLPTPNFAFGIAISQISLLAFHPSFAVRVEHHRLSGTSLLAIGDTISVDNTTTDRSLRLFQFVITPDSATTEQPIEMLPSTAYTASVTTPATTLSGITSSRETITTDPGLSTATDGGTTTDTLEVSTSTDVPTIADTSTIAGVSATDASPMVDISTAATSTEEVSTTTDASTMTELYTTTIESSTMAEASTTDAPTTSEISTATPTTTTAEIFTTTTTTDAPTMALLTTAQTSTTITREEPSTAMTAGTSEDTTTGNLGSLETTQEDDNSSIGGTTDSNGDTTGDGDLEPSAAEGGSSGRVGAVVGGVVGVSVVVALLVTIVIVCVVVAVLKRRPYWKLDDGEDISYPNAVYGSDEQYETVKSDYVGIGPHTYSEVGEAADLPHSYEQISQGHSQEYSYAYIGSGQRNHNHDHVATHLSLDKLQLPHARECLKEEQLLATKAVYQVETSFDTESIYQVPGKDETALYAQLNEILTDDVTRDAVVLGDFLGSGQFGTVYKGVWQSAVRGRLQIAVKTLKEGSGEEDRVKFLQEAAIMGQFKHHNVVEMYGVVTIGEPLLLLLEILKNGNLRDYLLHIRSDEEGGAVSVDNHTLLKYCRQVASGMTYLSSKAFVHRDLAARNVLVSDDDMCKIADFGMSRDLADENYYVSHGGKIPVKWTAPEALHYKKYSTASDVWSYGVLMYEIWSLGHKPFEDISNNKVLKLVDTGYRLPPPPGCPRALYAMMMPCWHTETSGRPNFADISHQLSLPDAELLKWTEEDKCTHPEVDKLGADLLCAQDLYRDLQVLYKRHE